MARFLDASALVLRPIRPVRGRILAAFLVLHTALLLGFRTAGFREFGRYVDGVTDGLIQHSLVANWIVAATLFVGLLWGLGNVRLRDVGLKRGWAFGWQFMNALLVTYLTWALVYLLTVTLGHWGGLTLAPNPTWTDFHAPYTTVLGDSIAALLGSALVEELTYRAFLLPQLALLLGSWTASPALRLGGALVLSQVLFGLNHIPVGLEYGFAGSVLALYVIQVTAVGMVFAALYLQTGNVLIPVGMHALINVPLPLYVTPIDPQFLALLVVIALAIAWPWTATWLGDVFRGQRLHAIGRLARRFRP